jgi:hypothetical protein
LKNSNSSIIDLYLSFLLSLATILFLLSKGFKTALSYEREKIKTHSPYLIMSLASNNYYTKFKNYNFRTNLCSLQGNSCGPQSFVEKGSDMLLAASLWPARICLRVAKLLNLSSGPPGLCVALCGPQGNLCGSQAYESCTVSAMLEVMVFDWGSVWLNSSCTCI